MKGKRKKKMVIKSELYDIMREEVGMNTIKHHKEGRFKGKWMPPTFFNMIGNLYKTMYGWRVSYPHNLKLGYFTDIGTYTYIQAQFDVSIGNRTQIGSHCSIYSHDTERNIKGAVIIEDNVMIGAHTLILPNVIIREGTKVPAKSILDGGEWTKDNIKAKLKGFDLDDIK